MMDLQAQLLTSFLLPMLEYDPQRRATARHMLSHPWLSSDSDSMAGHMMGAESAHGTTSLRTSADDGVTGAPEAGGSRTRRRSPIDEGHAGKRSRCVGLDQTLYAAGIIQGSYPCLYLGSFGVLGIYIGIIAQVLERDNC